MTYKKELRKKAFFQSGTKDDRKKFHDCLKAINELKKIESEKVISKTALHQEKSCNKNHRKFSKKVINCSLNTPEQQVGFSVVEANVYYPLTYAHSPSLDMTPAADPLNWFPNIPVDPTSGQNYTPFNADPIRPQDIRSKKI